MWFSVRPVHHSAALETRGLGPLFGGLTPFCAHDGGQAEIGVASFQPSRGQMEPKLTLSPRHPPVACGRETGKQHKHTNFGTALRLRMIPSPQGEPTYSTLSLCLKLSKTVLPSMKREAVPELTRISSKGQVVIPSRLRKKLGIEAGSVFAILTPRKGDFVVLKRVNRESLRADLQVFQEVERAWREIERGEARRAPRKGFLEELETW